jgi:hypothetical protein
MANSESRNAARVTPAVRRIDRRCPSMAGPFYARPHPAACGARGRKCCVCNYDLWPNPSPASTATAPFQSSRPVVSYRCAVADCAITWFRADAEMTPACKSPMRTLTTGRNSVHDLSGSKVESGVTQALRRRHNDSGGTVDLPIPKRNARDARIPAPPSG